MLKKLFILAMAVLVGIQPLQASAGDVRSAFANLMGPGSAYTTSGPGRYTAGARNLFVGGGAELRFPRSQITLVSISPPSFNAGCSGISAHFGGFSFISGKEIEQLVRNIAQGAPGLVINLVIKALCPMCEAVLQNMQQLASFAAKSNLDSCQMAAGLVGKFLPTTDEGTDAVNKACNVKSVKLNGASDVGAANIAVCNSLNKSVAAMKKTWADMEAGLFGPDGKPSGTPGAKASPQDTAAEKCNLQIGNCTWQVLSQMFAAKNEADVTDPGIRQRLLLLNLMGTTLVGEAANCGAAAIAQEVDGAPIQTVHCLPKLEPREAVGLFMCGVPSAKPSDTEVRMWTDYCLGMFAKSGTGAAIDIEKNVLTAINGLEVMTCADPKNPKDSPYKDCESLKRTTVGELKLVEGDGFILEVSKTLQEAVRRVRENRAMYEGPDDLMGARIMKLVEIAPYPLYQAINAAAVYPEAGMTLVDSLSFLVADHLAYTYFQQMLSKTAASKFGGLTVSSAMVNKVADGMHSLRMEADSNRSRMGKTLASQQLVMEEIRKVNQVIQQSVMSEQMLNMQKYATTINNKAADPSSTGD
jgi:hypothetical protein